MDYYGYEAEFGLGPQVKQQPAWSLSDAQEWLRRQQAKESQEDAQERLKPRPDSLLEGATGLVVPSRTLLLGNLSTIPENGSGLDVPPSATVAPPAAAAPPSAKERLAQAEAMLKIGGLLTPPRDDKPPTMTAPGVIPGRAPFAGQDFRLGAGRQRQYFVPQGFLR